MITDNLTTAVYFSDLLPKKCPILNQHIAEVLEANGTAANTMQPAAVNKLFFISFKI